MYHQSHVSGENEATFGIGRRPHHAFGIIAETKLLRRDAKSPAIQLPVSILILEKGNGIRARRKSLARDGERRIFYIYPESGQGFLHERLFRVIEGDVEMSLHLFKVLTTSSLFTSASKNTPNTL